MAQPYVTGSVSIWIRHPHDSVPSFLGHGEKAPVPQFDVSMNDVICDISGTQPLDTVYAGESATVSVDLIRFNNSVLGAIQARARSATFPAAVAGFDAPGMIGTLMVAEGCAYELWLRNDGAAKPTMNNAVNGAIMGGWHFFAAVLQPESFTLGSANAMKVHLVWKCYRVFSATAGAFGFGSFVLYDYNLAAVAALPLN